MAVDDATLTLFADLATPTLANALDDVPFDGVIDGLRQVVPGSRCVGRAVTVKQVSGPRGSFTSADFAVGAMIDAAGAGDILVIDNAGEAISTWGGMATLAARVKGLGGLVVDGGVRDREEIEVHGLPVFARHMTPLTGRTRLKIEAINEGPVRCRGVMVNPGDVIVADGSGVVCIPAAVARAVGEAAQAFANDDAQAEAALRSGLTFSEAMGRFTRI
ncbi:MAG: RraA family protein [Pseudomonadota bacterium]